MVGRNVLRRMGKVISFGAFIAPYGAIRTCITYPNQKLTKTRGLVDTVTAVNDKL